MSYNYKHVFPCTFSVAVLMQKYQAECYQMMNVVINISYVVLVLTLFLFQDNTVFSEQYFPHVKKKSKQIFLFVCQ